MTKEKILEWLRAAVARAVRTFAQTAAASIGAAALISDVSWVQVLSASTLAALISDVSWVQVLSASTLAAILSLLMSIGGLPELK